MRPHGEATARLRGDVSREPERVSPSTTSSFHGRLAAPEVAPLRRAARRYHRETRRDESQLGRPSYNQTRSESL
jgi:hypothetical protein